MGSSRLEDGPAFAEDMAVEVRFMRTKEDERGDRNAWPWLPGTIVEPCGPDVCGACASRSASWQCAKTAASPPHRRQSAGCSTSAVTGIAPR